LLESDAIVLPLPDPADVDADTTSGDHPDVRVRDVSANGADVKRLVEAQRIPL